MGRPSKYSKEVVKQAYKLSLLGLTDAQMASVFDVTERTFNNWKNKHPEFFQSIKKGKDIADSNVAASLYERACGYTHPEEKLFQYEGKVIRAKTKKHYPPDTAAICMWLKNRQPAIWKDRVPEGSGDTPVLPVNVNFTMIDGRKDANQSGPN